jgi:hypothetical protein
LHLRIELIGAVAHRQKMLVIHRPVMIACASGCLGRMYFQALVYANSDCEYTPSPHSAPAR